MAITDFWNPLSEFKKSSTWRNQKLFNFHISIPQFFINKLSFALFIQKKKQYIGNIAPCCYLTNGGSYSPDRITTKLRQNYWGYLKLLKQYEKYYAPNQIVNRKIEYRQIYFHLFGPLQRRNDAITIKKTELLLSTIFLCM